MVHIDMKTEKLISLPVRRYRVDLDRMRACADMQKEEDEKVFSELAWYEPTGRGFVVILPKTEREMDGIENHP